MTHGHRPMGGTYRSVSAIRAIRPRCSQRRYGAKSVRPTDSSSNAACFAATNRLSLRYGEYAGQREDFNACTTFRSISARASTLCSGVTFHSSRPHAGISRMMRSASSFDGASMMNTNARSPTGTPPARIFPSAFSLIMCSKCGITVLQVGRPLAQVTLAVDRERPRPDIASLSSL